MKYFGCFLIILLFLSNNFANGKRFRVSQLPNGGVNDCANCHLYKAEKTPFGKDIEENFLKDGDVVWGPELANLDSDGDGFTNGEELQDPNGEWQSGEADPGNANLVSLPGDDQSTPPQSSVSRSIAAVNSLSISPNPIFQEVNINFELKKSGNVSIHLYDIEGNFIKTLTNEFMSTGAHNLQWSKAQIPPYSLTSGVYWLRFDFDGSSMVRKLMITN